MTSTLSCEDSPTAKASFLLITNNNQRTLLTLCDLRKSPHLFK
jgi:hypothetical protein